MHLVPVARRKGVRLPLGGRQHGIGCLQVQQVIGVAQAQFASRLCGSTCCKLRIKPYVRANGAVKVFAVHQQASPWPDIAHEQRLAPARMGHDHIRREALITHGTQGLKAGLPTQDLGLQIF